MNVAVIPARGGSKRIPRKNIKNFCGKPMISWSIEAARLSKCFERIIVSTDDIEIADISIKLGAEIPFLRPAYLSDDHAGTMAVIKHAVEWLNSQTDEAENVCCLYATAPFVQATDLARGLDLLCQQSCDYTFSVTSFAFPIQRALRISANHRIEMFQPDQFATRSQDLEEAYHDAGQFYWGRAQAWLAETPLFSKNSFPVILPRYRVQDIDTKEDWIRAELMFSALQQIGIGR